MRHAGNEYTQEGLGDELRFEPIRATSEPTLHRGHSNPNLRLLVLDDGVVLRHAALFWASAKSSSSEDARAMRLSV